MIVTDSFLNKGSCVIKRKRLIIIPVAYINYGDDSWLTNCVLTAKPLV
jgi:hypothetical protein